MKKFYVYLLFRPWDGTPCYAGKGSGNRIKQHFADGEKHCNRHLANIIKKAGEPLPYLILHSDLDEASAFALEVWTIATIGRRANGGPLVNMTDGGEGVSGFSHKHRPETKELLKTLALARNAALPKKVKPVPVVWKGQKHKNETKAVMSEKTAARWEDPEDRARMEEHNRNIAKSGAAANKARWENDPEFREAQIAKRKGQKRSPEACARIKANKLAWWAAKKAKEKEDA